ncbi:hypothetical protein NLJ89_g1145 [Agrocybe chaxingu]|uniref:Uncharacterized protein n=1 Tax=Agrocybe chaxingu TaxID=84603 RepID=A0A9W8TEW3_9AGAR|nr:hypothetical protein NLJ89_g1145 [Agrocybe chaxingu]
MFLDCLQSFPSKIENELGIVLKYFVASIARAFQDCLRCTSQDANIKYNADLAVGQQSGVHAPFSPFSSFSPRKKDLVLNTFTSLACEVLTGLEDLSNATLPFPFGRQRTLIFVVLLGIDASIDCIKQDILAYVYQQLIEVEKLACNNEWSEMSVKIFKSIQCQHHIGEPL